MPERERAMSPVCARPVFKIIKCNLSFRKAPEMCLSRTDFKQAGECQVGVEVTLSWAGLSWACAVAKEIGSTCQGTQGKRDRERESDKGITQGQHTLS